jgi:hypothetical protein
MTWDSQNIITQGADFRESCVIFLFFYQALFLWDIIMLHGAQVVPNLCAACLLVLKGPLEGYVSTSRSLLLLNRSIYRSLLTRGAFLIGSSLVRVSGLC